MPVSEQDDILNKYISKIEEENKELKSQLKAKPKPILGIGTMWENYCSSEGSQIASVLLGVILIICTTIVCYNVFVPEPPPARLTNRFHLSSWGDCYKIIQEKENGETKEISPCIKDKNEALKFLKEIKSEAGNNKSFATVEEVQ